MSLEDAVARFKLSTHNYIRRQLTWFRSQPDVTWLDAAQPRDLMVLESGALVLPWLSSGT